MFHADSDSNIFGIQPTPGDPLKQKCDKREGQPPAATIG
jgi:hypothetical protein